jgi:hypothetical protein
LLLPGRCLPSFVLVRRWLLLPSANGRNYRNFFNAVPSSSPVQLINKATLQLQGRKWPGMSPRSPFENRTPFRSQEQTHLAQCPLLRLL